jgi:hypothetical protein
MTHPSRSCLAARVVLLLALALPASAQSVLAQSINDRKTSARAVIAGSRGRYDGSFAANATSSICGEIPKESSLTGVATFVVEFPSEGNANAPIQSIAFGSSQLVGGVTTASVFRLDVAVLTAQGGRPPSYVLNTDAGDAKNTGTATLARSKGSLTLKVAGRNDMGESIDLTIECM